MAPGGTRELSSIHREHTWFYRDIARHWACMSPRMQQTLQDWLEDVPRATIMERDHVRREALQVRWNALVAFFTGMCTTGKPPARGAGELADRHRAEAR